MADKKGIIRHKSLYPLSHHHHHGLFLAMNLKRAGTEKSKKTEAELKEELLAFWQNGGQEHFREEEEILLPVYAAYASVDQEEIKEMLLEHVKVRALIWEIDRSEEILVAKMQELGSLLEAHIRKEERILFPMMEEAIPEDILNELAPLFHTTE